MAINLSSLSVIRNNQAFEEAVTAGKTLQVTTSGGGNLVSSDICFFCSADGDTSQQIQQSGEPTELGPWATNIDAYFLAAMPVSASPAPIPTGQNTCTMTIGAADGESSTPAVTLSLTFSNGGTENLGSVNGSTIVCNCQALNTAVQSTFFIFPLFTLIGDNNFDTVTINANNSAQKDVIVNIYRGSTGSLLTTIKSGNNSNNNLIYKNDAAKGDIYVAGFISPSNSGNTLSFSVGDPKTDAQVSITEVDAKKKWWHFFLRLFQLK